MKTSESTRAAADEAAYSEWFRSSDDTRIGYVKGVTFEAKPVEYSIINGLAIFEGDIVLGDTGELDTRGEMDFSALPISGVEHGVVIVPERFRWPRGEVPFEIDPAFPDPQIVRRAIAHWEQNTPIRFPERTAATAVQFPDFVRFVSRDGCWSQVGMRGGMQEISLGAGCGFGAAVHEIGHAVGLWHEQSREDRDRHIRIRWENILPDREHNFNQHITDGDDVGTYDFGSIMHYPATAFSINGQATIDTLNGEAIGQRNGLSAGDIAAVRYMYSPGFGNLSDGRPFWVGNFSRADRSDLLFYYPGDDNWWLGTHDGSQLQWNLVGNTAGFGHAINDGRPFWIGDFNGDGRSDILMYYPGDGNWWLGTMVNNQLQWGLAGNTAGFGYALNDGRPFWVSNFSRADRSDLLFYYPGDDNWWLGTHDGSQLQWNFVGNTAGFGHAINDGRPFWIGDFNGDGRSDILMYYPGDGNWWLGTMVNNQLQWGLAGNTMGAPRPKPILVQCQYLSNQLAKIDAEITSLQKELRNAAPGEKPGIVAQIRQLQRQRITVARELGDCITRHSPPPLPPWPNFGQVWDGRPFWIGNLSRADRSEVLFYSPGDDNWWLGSFSDNQLSWTLAGNTVGFGHGIDDGRPFWTGNFSRADRTEVLFFYPGDDNWWLGSHGGSQINWTLASNTAGFGHDIDDGRPFWIGDFNGDGRADVLFYYPGDGNWWLGSHRGSQLTWTFAGNTGRP